MKIKKGWIYKYNDWCIGKPCTIDWVNDSKSICPYFWKSMWNICVPILFFVWWNLFAGGIGLAIFENLSTFSRDTLHTLPWYELCGILFLGASAVTLLFGLILAVFGFIIYAVAFLIEKLKATNKVSSDTNPSHNVFVSYIKAKKSKICPMIEWED